MANRITNNPVLVDTPGAGNIVSSHFRVTAILWDPGTAAANQDVVTVRDKNNDIKFSQTLITGNLVPAHVSFPAPIPFDGLRVTAMTRGTLYVYLADKNDLKA